MTLSARVFLWRWLGSAPREGQGIDSAAVVLIGGMGRMWPAIRNVLCWLTQPTVRTPCLFNGFDGLVPGYGVVGVEKRALLLCHCLMSLL